MSLQAPSQGRMLPGWLLPAVAGVVVVVTLGAFLFMAQRVGREQQPPALSSFEGPAYVQPTNAFDVKQRDGNVLQLVPATVKGQPPADTRTVTVSGRMRLEGIQRVSSDSVRAGDWVTVVGVPNKVRNFAIRSVVVIPGGTPASGETFAKSTGGFMGHEASRDPTERPIVGGVVKEVSGSSIVFDGPDGPVTVTLAPSPPLFRITEIQASAVGEGDRAAAASWPDGSAPAAMLFSK